MKVLAFNGSPLMEKGNTALILNPFLEGARQAGAEVELLYIAKLNIHDCLGDFNCWMKTPGTCHQADDMQLIHPKLREADVWVFASPVYVWGVSGTMKVLMDRFLPLIEPSITLNDGHCSHPLRAGTKRSKIVLVSNCGFWEMDNFDPLLAQMRMLCRVIGFEFAGSLLRPAGPLLAAMLEMGAPVEDILEAAREAGRQLVRDGVISARVQQIVSRDLMPRDSYIQALNQNIAMAAVH